MNVKVEILISEIDNGFIVTISNTNTADGSVFSSIEYFESFDEVLSRVQSVKFSGNV